MQMPEATIIYSVDSAPVIARGIAYTEEQLDEAINGPVKDLLADTTGTSELNDMLAGLASTEFAQDQIKQLLHAGPELKDWRVGEALAEVYVVDKENCIFPWPASRDLKNPEASPPGADLTGFQKTGEEENPFRFAFGEVKTSSDEDHPPNVMHGPKGLKKQLEELRDSDPARKNLILYLARHARNMSWWHMFESAVKRYLNSDIAIFGILIRDVSPDESDLSSCASSLASGCPASTSIALYAMYLPVNAVSLLGARAHRALQGGER